MKALKMKKQEQKSRNTKNNNPQSPLKNNC